MAGFMVGRLLPWLAATRPQALRASPQARLPVSMVGVAHRFYVKGGSSEGKAPDNAIKTVPSSAGIKHGKPDTSGGASDAKPSGTVTSSGPLDPKATASSIIDLLPSNGIATKTSMIFAGIGSISWLVSKEIYIFNEDTIISGCFFIVCYLAVKYGSGPLKQLSLDRHNHIFKILQEARDRHRNIVKSRIDEVDRMSDIVDVTKNLFEMSKDMAKLEAQIFELQQKTALNSEIKTVLDSWVRHELAVRQREQTEISQAVIDRVRKSLTDPKVQDQILLQAVADVERLAAAK